MEKTCRKNGCFVLAQLLEETIERVGHVLENNGVAGWSSIVPLSCTRVDEWSVEPRMFEDCFVAG